MLIYIVYALSSLLLYTGASMRTKIIILLLFVFLLIKRHREILPENEAAAAQIQVINLSIDPAILMPYDTATVTITLTNTGTKSVAISRAGSIFKGV